MDPMNERSAADELAAAEAELKAAQERLDAARQRVASGQPQQPASYASQPATAWQPDAPAQGQPYMPQAGAQQPAQPYAAPQGSAYAQPQTQAAQQPYGAQSGYGSVPPQNPYGQQAQYGYQQPYVAPTVGEKDHVAAGLLALFLGWLGVHKFYLGYNTSGFIMLGTSILGGILTLSVASWAIWVIAIVEGIFYLSKSQTEFEQMYVINKREWF